MTIQQGDQYSIPVKILIGETVVTPSNCTDVRVKVNNTLANYDSGSGALTYDSTNQVWKFPLTELMSFSYLQFVEIQAGVKFNSDFVYAPTQTIDIGKSIIKEQWNGS